MNDKTDELTVPSPKETAKAANPDYGSLTPTLAPPKSDSRPENRALYDKVRAQLGDEVFEQQVRDKIASFHGLLTRDAAVLLLAKDHGLLPKDDFIPLARASPGFKRFGVRARVERVFPVQTFTRNGVQTRTVRVLLQDDSGEATLVLWNNDVDLVERTFGTHDRIEITGAYFRNGELHLGFKGSAKVTDRAPATPIAQLEVGLVNVQGRIAQVFPPYQFLSRDGRNARMDAFVLEDDTGKARVIVWQDADAPRSGAANANETANPNWAPDDTVRLENAVFKNNELHVSRNGRVALLASSRPANSLEGKLTGLELLTDGAVRATIDNTATVFAGALALGVLGIKQIPEGVKLETIARLKLPTLEGKHVRVQFAKNKKESAEKEAETITWLAEETTAEAPVAAAP